MGVGTVVAGVLIAFVIIVVVVIALGALGLYALSGGFENKNTPKSEPVLVAKSEDGKAEIRYYESRNCKPNFELQKWNCPKDGLSWEEYKASVGLDDPTQFIPGHIQPGNLSQEEIDKIDQMH